MARVKKALTKTQMKKLKDKLLAAKEEILNKAQEMEQFCLDKNELSDPLDEASENIQKSTELRFRSREIFYLKKINKTIAKMERDEYGLCNECDEPIVFERLWARPVADMCISCKEESEKKERCNVFGRQSKSKGIALHEMAR